MIVVERSEAPFTVMYMGLEMNEPGRTLALFNYLYLRNNWSKSLCRVKTIPSKYSTIEMCNYDNLKLCAFQNRRNFGNFPKFFYQNFRLNWMCQILMVSSERSLSVLSKLTLFQLEKICINENILYM